MIRWFFSKNFAIGVTKTVLINRSYSTKRLTNAQKESFSISPELKDIIIGLTLGDLYIQNFCNVNPRLMFKQGLVNKDYISHLFELFSNYSNMKTPKHYDSFDKRHNKTYSSIYFNTYSLPCFNYYHSLFYKNNIKTISLNIGELLTPAGLAYWAMDDGEKNKDNFVLCTDSYSLSEIELLIKVLKDNFNINCSFHMIREGQYRINIRKDSMEIFREVVLPHFHESMLYKLK